MNGQQKAGIAACLYVIRRVITRFDFDATGASRSAVENERLTLHRVVLGGRFQAASVSIWEFWKFCAADGF